MLELISDLSAIFLFFFLSIKENGKLAVQYMRQLLDRVLGRVEFLTYPCNYPLLHI